MQEHPDPAAGTSPRVHPVGTRSSGARTPLHGPSPQTARIPPQGLRHPKPSLPAALPAAPRTPPAEAHIRHRKRLPGLRRAAAIAAIAAGPRSGLGCPPRCLLRRGRVCRSRSASGTGGECASWRRPARRSDRGETGLTLGPGLGTPGGSALGWGICTAVQGSELQAGAEGLPIWARGSNRG